MSIGITLAYVAFSCPNVGGTYGFGGRLTTPVLDGVACTVCFVSVNRESRDPHLLAYSSGGGGSVLLNGCLLSLLHGLPNRCRGGSCLAPARGFSLQLAMSSRGGFCAFLTCSTRKFKTPFCSVRVQNNACKTCLADMMYCKTLKFRGMFFSRINNQ